MAKPLSCAQICSLNAAIRRTAMLVALALTTGLTGSCKLLDEGYSTLGQTPLPPDFAPFIGHFWGGHDGACTYVQGFPSSDTFESLMACRETNVADTQSDTTKITGESEFVEVTRISRRFSAESRGQGEWTITLPKGFLTSNCHTVGDSSEAAQAFEVRMTAAPGTQDNSLETSTRGKSWLPHTRVEPGTVEKLRQAASKSMVGC